MEVKRKILNVRGVLERIINFNNSCLTQEYAKLPPVYQHELNQIAFLSKKILQKNSHHRKDLYVEKSS